MNDSRLPQFQLNRKTLALRASAMIALSLIIAFLFFALFQSQEKQRYAALTKAFHQSEISVVTLSFENEFAGVIDDLLVLGNSSESAAYIENPDSLWNISEMARIFRNFQKNNPYYRTLTLYGSGGMPILQINPQGRSLQPAQTDSLTCLTETITANPLPTIRINPSCPTEGIIFVLPVYTATSQIGCYLQIEYDPAPLYSLTQTHAINHPNNFYGLYLNGQTLYESSRKEWALAPESLGGQIENSGNASDSNYTHLVEFGLADLVKNHSEIPFDSKLTLLFLIQSKPPSLFYLENPEVRSFILIEGMILLIWFALAIYLSYTAAIRVYARNQQRLMGEVLQSLNESIAITDDRYRVIYANPAFCRMLNYSPEEIPGLKVRKFRSKRNSAAYLRNISDSLLEKGVWEGKLWEQMSQGDDILKWVKIQKIVHPNRSIRYYGVYNDIDATRDTTVRDYHSTYYDLLTDLPNETLLPKLLSEAIDSHRQARLQMGIAVLHLHPIETEKDAGETRNQAVKAFAKRLMEEVNQSMGILARTDSTEFTLTFPMLASEEDLFATLNRVKEQLEKPYAFESSEPRSLPYSMGLSLYPQDGGEASKLMELARIQASDATKRVFQDSRLSAAYRRYSQIDDGLKSAILDSQFKLHYQPQSDPDTGKVRAMESLIRWMHPELGAISPQEFIPIAEKNGMIIPIGEWIFNEVCGFIRSAKDKGIEPVPISVNVSMAQLEDPHFVERILSMLDRCGLAKDLIELEITESMLMKNIRLGKAHLKNLSGLGFKLAIDDFGTGYSSLAYLKELEVDKVKLDRLFIKDYPLHDDGLVLRLIAQMLKGLSYKLLIEGVETEEQRDYVNALGIDLIQGDYFSKPLAAHQAQDYLSSH